MTRPDSEPGLDEIALHGTDAEWYAATGNCGRCGSPVAIEDLAERFRGNLLYLCRCTDCGCGPHPAFDARPIAVDVDQPALFEQQV